MFDALSYCWPSLKKIGVIYKGIVFLWFLKNLQLICIKGSSTIGFS